MLQETLRSEAHFAAMLYYEVRQSPEIGGRLLKLVETELPNLKRAAPPGSMKVGEFTNVFVEPAPFRDAWDALNEESRRQLIITLLTWISPAAPVNHFPSMFDVAGRSRSPASWDLKEMESALPAIKRLYFMFRARPDLLLLTTHFAIWVELKVESPEGAGGNGYVQSATQRDIATAAHFVVPQLKALDYVNVTIRRNLPMGYPTLHESGISLTWKQLVGDRDDWKKYHVLQLNKG